MPKINILPKEVYQLIAAGEVVERPSSVIKEMIENSVDALAKNITIEIKNGGVSYMRITDDGIGIERAEVEKVFTPHATSKIKVQQDLDSIATLGFRGEAMASIGAVAKVELLTRAKNAQIGTRYSVSGEEHSTPDDAGCPEGTTIVVRDLFFNTPARMKFLKSDKAESNAVSAVVDRMALSHPEIAFRFIRDGKQTLVTNGKNDLKNTVFSVYGKELSDSLIEADYSYASMHLTGYVSKPSMSRKSRQMQFFFINGRMVKSKTAMAALEQSYKNSIMVGRYPACILNIEMNTSLVDVNVHPAKLEVRFAQEKPVFDLVYYGVKTAIQKGDTIKAAHLSNNNSFSNQNKSAFAFSKGSVKNGDDFFKVKSEEPVQTVLKSEPREDFWQVQKPKAHYNVDIQYDDDESPVINNHNDTTKNITDNKPDLEEKPKEAIESNETKTDDLPKRDNQTVKIVNEDQIAPDFRYIGQAFSTYFIIEIEKDLYLIDKHAAHERMNYERLREQSEINQQYLLIPKTVNLTKEEFDAVVSNLDLLMKCGFEVEEFGTGSVIVRSVPAMIDDADVTDLIEEIANKLLQHKTDIEPDKMDWIFHSASCRGAVKARDFTSDEEARLFIKKLLSMPNIRYCPHGRPVMIKLSQYEIEKQFGRVT